MRNQLKDRNRYVLSSQVPLPSLRQGLAFVAIATAIASHLIVWGPGAQRRLQHSFDTGEVPWSRAVAVADGLINLLAFPCLTPYTLMHPSSYDPMGWNLLAILNSLLLSAIIVRAINAIVARFRHRGGPSTPDEQSPLRA